MKKLLLFISIAILAFSCTEKSDAKEQKTDSFSTVKTQLKCDTTFQKIVYLNDNQINVDTLCKVVRCGEGAFVNNSFQYIRIDVINVVGSKNQVIDPSNIIFAKFVK